MVDGDGLDGGDRPPSTVDGANEVPPGTKCDTDLAAELAPDLDPERVQDRATRRRALTALAAAIGDEVFY